MDYRNTAGPSHPKNSGQRTKTYPTAKEANQNHVPGPSSSRLTSQLTTGHSTKTHKTTKDDQNHSAGPSPFKVPRMYEDDAYYEFQSQHRCPMHEFKVSKTCSSKRCARYYEKNPFHKGKGFQSN